MASVGIFYSELWQVTSHLSSEARGMSSVFVLIASSWCRLILTPAPGPRLGCVWTFQSWRKHRFLLALHHWKDEAHNSKSIEASPGVFYWFCWSGLLIAEQCDTPGPWWMDRKLLGRDRLFTVVTSAAWPAGQLGSPPLVIMHTYILLGDRVSTKTCQT